MLMWLTSNEFWRPFMQAMKAVLRWCVGTSWISF